MVSEELLLMIHEVASIRRCQASLTAQLAELKKKFEEDNAELIQEVKGGAADLVLAEEKLRHLAANAYDTDPTNKKVAPGVTIKMFTEIGYDKKLAFDWALEHKIALTLDTKAFEKIAPTANLDFVLVTQVPKATIATDLEKALGEL
jgi:hypothetical protein